MANVWIGQAGGGLAQGLFQGLQSGMGFVAKQRDLEEAQRQHDIAAAFKGIDALANTINMPDEWVDPYLNSLGKVMPIDKNLAAALKKSRGTMGETIAGMVPWLKQQVVEGKVSPQSLGAMLSGKMGPQAFQFLLQLGEQYRQDELMKSLRAGPGGTPTVDSHTPTLPGQMLPDAEQVAQTIGAEREYLRAQGITGPEAETRAAAIAADKLRPAPLEQPPATTQTHPQAAPIQQQIAQMETWLNQMRATPGITGTNLKGWEDRLEAMKSQAWGQDFMRWTQEAIQSGTTDLRSAQQAAAQKALAKYGFIPERYASFQSQAQRDMPITDWTTAYAAAAQKLGVTVEPGVVNPKVAEAARKIVVMDRLASGAPKSPAGREYFEVYNRTGDSVAATEAAAAVVQRLGFANAWGGAQGTMGGAQPFGTPMPGAPGAGPGWGAGQPQAPGGAPAPVVPAKPPESPIAAREREKIGATPLEASDKSALDYYTMVNGVVNQFETFTPEEIQRFSGILNRPIQQTKLAIRGILGQKGSERFAEFKAVSGRAMGAAFKEGGKQLTPFEAEVVFSYTPTGKEAGGATEILAKLKYLKAFAKIAAATRLEMAKTGRKDLTLDMLENTIRAKLRESGLPQPEDLKRQFAGKVEPGGGDPVQDLLRKKGLAQ